MIRAKRGFTLVEMMIVLVIIGIIAAFAIPSMLESRTSANESGAGKALRTIVDAEATFFKTDYDGDGHNYSYKGPLGNGITNLNTQPDANGNPINLIDAALASLTKEGYIYGECDDYDAAGTADRRGFAYYAVPEVYKQSARKTYVVSSNLGVIFYKDTGNNTPPAGFPGATMAAMAAAGWVQEGS